MALVILAAGLHETIPLLFRAGLTDGPTTLQYPSTLRTPGHIAEDVPGAVVTSAGSPSRCGQSPNQSTLTGLSDHGGSDVSIGLGDTVALVLS